MLTPPLAIPERCVNAKFRLPLRSHEIINSEPPNQRQSQDPLPSLIPGQDQVSSIVMRSISFRSAGAFANRRTPTKPSRPLVPLPTTGTSGSIRRPDMPAPAIRAGWLLRRTRTHVGGPAIGPRSSGPTRSLPKRARPRSVRSRTVGSRPSWPRSGSPSSSDCPGGGGDRVEASDRSDRRGRTGAAGGVAGGPWLRRRSLPLGEPRLPNPNPR